MNLHHGDCLDVMATLPEASVDAIVTDPPYGLEFMGKEWDRLGGAGFHAPKDEGRTFTNASGHMFDNLKSLPRYGSAQQAQVWHQRWAEAAYRVAKPSAYLLAFGGTRTVHRMTCALEDAGWIIRDMLVWGYASGFPKSKASLKPAWEPIVMARKPGPLRMLAIDECRIPGAKPAMVDLPSERTDMAAFETRGRTMVRPTRGAVGQPIGTGYDPADEVRFDAGRGWDTSGRWPANIVLTDAIFDGGIEGVVGGGEAGGGFGTRGADGSPPPAGWGMRQTGETVGYGDTGTYSRFFLVPKSSRSDREPVLGGQIDLGERVFMGSGGRTFRDGEWHETHSTPRQRENSHPTVKPVDLMRHLVRLVTPTGGTVLDPFLGSGTTALAAEMEGFAWVGIEREAEYVAIAEARLNGTQRGLGLEAAGGR